MMTIDMGIGLYVHIPFCKSKCAYCDFCSSPDFDSELVDRYIAAVLREADGYLSANGTTGRGILVDTVYFGGGTPSLLSAPQMSRLMDGLRSRFDISDGAEVTAEVNPGTLDRERARAYRDIGIGRVSMGLQSIHKNELKRLGRIHTHDDFLRSYDMLRSVGIDNIGLDLMYGIPEQTTQSFSETLEAVCAIAPEHISVYGLIIEEGTRFFGERATLPLPGEDEECDMYYLACTRLGEAGYGHYEVSNYARSGRECRHNLKYWRDEEYIGLGLSAYSYYSGRRYGNCRDMGRYLGGELMSDNNEIIDKASEAYEYAMMRLRLAEGIDLADYERRYSRVFCEGKEKLVGEYISLGLMREQQGRLALTERGFYVSNHILVNIL